MSCGEFECLLNHFFHVENVKAILFVQKFGLGLFTRERIASQTNFQIQIVRVGWMLQSRSLLVIDLDNLL